MVTVERAVMRCLVRTHEARCLPGGNTGPDNTGAGHRPWAERAPGIINQLKINLYDICRTCPGLNMAHQYAL